MIILKIHFIKMFYTFLKLNFAATKMINLSNFSKLGFSRISTIPATAGQIVSSRKFCEKILDKNSVNSIIDEIKTNINKLETEMEHCILVEKDVWKMGPKPWKAHYKKIRLETMEYMVDEEPKQRKMKIELKEDENGEKLIHIFRKEEEDTSCWYPYILPMISMPDAYSVLDAMQTLELEWPENYAKALRQYKQRYFFSWKLEIHLLPNNQLDFRMMATTPNFDKSREIKLYLLGPIPIDVFYWLKEQMAEILADCDEEFDDDE